MKFQKITPALWLIAAFIIVIAVWGYAMWANYGELPAKVEALQNEVAIMKAGKDSLHSTALSLEKLELKIDKVDTSIREDFEWLKKFGIPLTLLAFAGLFFSIYKSALGFALGYAQETVNKYYLPDEERFKQEKKLLVLTKEGGDSEFIRKLLFDTGFLHAATIPENVKTLEEDSLKKILGGNKYDLILVNNENAAFSDDEIIVCHDKTPDFTMIFSFNKSNLPKNLTASQRVSSANFKSQVYANLINALKYQKYIKRTAQGVNA